MTTKKINILVLSYVHEGGEWIATQRLIKMLTELSDSLRFFLIGYTEGFKVDINSFEKILYIEAENVNRPFSFLRKLFFDFFKVRRAIIKLTKETESINIVLVSYFLMIFPLYSLYIIKKERVLFLFHGTKCIIKKFSDIDYRKIVILILERLALLLSSSIVVPSKFAEKFVQSLIYPLSYKKNYYLLPNGIHEIYLKKYSQNSLVAFRNLINIPISNKIILYSGRIVQYKGLEILIDAFIKILNFQRNLSLIIAYPKSSSDPQLLNLLNTTIREKDSGGNMVFKRSSESYIAWEKFQEKLCFRNIWAFTGWNAKKSLENIQGGVLDGYKFENNKQAIKQAA